MADVRCLLTMNGVPDHALKQAVWAALSTTHSHLAQRHGQASRYPPAVAPFAAVRSHHPEAFNDLRELLSPGETIYLQATQRPNRPGLLWGGVISCLQMTFPVEAAIPPVSPGISVETLDCGHASEMADLITIAYPGYFRPETCRMGHYFGVRDAKGDLVAMGGERLCFDPWHEISGLCSHPDQTSRGFGTAILRHILNRHRQLGHRSWLWVVESNRRAIDLYLRLGFQTTDRSQLHRITRPTG